MSKSILYAANTTAQTYAATGTVINFGTTIRRYGCNCNVSGGNVVIDGVGYYDVDANVSFNGAAGNAVIQVYKDGVAIPGAEATVTIVADTIYSITIPCVVRQTCCCDTIITVVISGVAGTVSNAGIVIEKL